MGLCASECPIVPRGASECFPDCTPHQADASRLIHEMGRDSQPAGAAGAPNASKRASERLSLAPDVGGTPLTLPVNRDAFTRVCIANGFTALQSSAFKEMGQAIQSSVNAMMVASSFVRKLPFGKKKTPPADAGRPEPEL